MHAQFLNYAKCQSKAILKYKLLTNSIYMTPEKEVFKFYNRIRWLIVRNNIMQHWRCRSSSWQKIEMI